MGLPSSQTKIWGKSVQRFLNYDRANRDYNFIYIDTLIVPLKRIETKRRKIKQQVKGNTYNKRDSHDSHMKIWKWNLI